MDQKIGFSLLTSYPVKGTIAVSSLVLLMALGACGKKDETVGQQLDSAVAKTEQVASEAKAKTEASMEKARAAMKNTTQSAEASGSKTADAMSAKIDDAVITASISAELAKNPELSAIRINVDTRNGVVTLNGPASTTAAKEKATTIAAAVKGVNSVDNKLVVKAN
ncbi:MAG: BON domain-containing protein [Pseudomonadota bacterium]